MQNPFLARALALPNAPLFAWARADGRLDATIDRQTALAKAAAVASKLRSNKRLAPGDRVLLVYPPGLEFIWALLGCQALGLVPVPVYPPRPAATDEDLARLARIAEDAGCKAALTELSYRWIVRWLQFRGIFSGQTLPSLEWLVTGSGDSDEPLEAPEYAEIALIQYTSGSTGDPRGVAITWANLEHQLDVNARVLGLDATSRSVMWVPQYHDLGLISGIMSAVYGNGMLVLASPLDFLTRPALWFDLVSQVQATHTAAPNFAFGLVLRRTTAEERANWRLGSLRVLMSAAEPIDGTLVDHFLDELAPFGLARETFFPAYGLAEHTVGVSMGGRGRAVCSRPGLELERRMRPPAAHERGQLVVGCGAPAPGVEVRIVADGQLQTDGHVGEIWVRSASVAAGYFGREAETRATFNATLPEGSGWLRTGDLGFMHAGELFVTGRLKDLIIVGGRNVYPQDVEALVAKVAPQVRPGCVAAFAVRARDTEAVGLVADLREGRDAERVAATIREGVLRELGIPVAQVALGLRGLVPKTTSGKVRRQATAMALADGSLARSKAWIGSWEAPTAEPWRQDAEDSGRAAAIAALEPAQRAPAMLALFGEVWRSFPGSQPLEPDVSFQAQGIDSLVGVEFVARLEKILGLPVPPMSLVGHPVPGHLADHLVRRLHQGAATPEGERSRHLAVSPWAPHGSRSKLDEPIAIIGAGVAGLVAADELVRLGYRNITIYEAGDEPGGKVASAEIAGEMCEIGAIYLMGSYADLIELARRLDVPLVPAAGDAMLVDSPESLDIDAGAAWLARVMEAAGGPMGSSWIAGLGERDPRLSLPLSEWLRHHCLGEPPYTVRIRWTAFGYGPIDESIPAYQFVEYFRVGMGRMLLPLKVQGGNQRLWRALAASLQTAGVQIRYRTPVQHVAGNLVDGRPYAAVIVTCPSEVVASLLSPDDERRALLQRFRRRLYRVTVVRSAAVARPAALLCLASTLARYRPGDPSVLVAGRAERGSDLWLAYQLVDDAEGRPLPEPLVQAAMTRDLKAMGIVVAEVLHERTWQYAPYLAPEDAGTWFELQALQGDRGLWIAGAASSFEAMEHAARHSRELVRLGFSPEACVPWVPPPRRLVGGRQLPAPATLTWSLGYLEGRHSAHENMAAVIWLDGDTDRVVACLEAMDGMFEGLRVLFAPGPVAWVDDALPSAPAYRDLSEEPNSRAAMLAWCSAEAARPFTLMDTRLYRTGIGRLPDGKIGLWLVAHHAILDADGMGAALVGLARLWHAHPGPLVEIPGRSVLEEVVEQELRRSAAAAPALHHWREKLAAHADSWLDVPFVEGPMIEHTVLLSRGAARRLALVDVRLGKPMVGFLARAAARVGDERCFGVVVNGFSGRVAVPRPPQVTMRPVWDGDDLIDLARFHVDEETYKSLRAEIGRSGVPWRWTLNHFTLPTHLAGLEVELISRPTTRFALEIATIADPSAGTLALRLQGRVPDYDAAGLAALATALALELEQLAAPRNLWEIGAGMIG